MTNTNLTINTTINTNLTNQEAISMENMNKSALVSTMAAELFHQGLNPVVSMITATAFIGSVDYMEDMEDFMEALVDGLEITTLEIVGIEKQPEYEIDGAKITDALIASNYLVMGDDIEMGTRLAELCSLRQEAYKPALATEGVTRRFNYSKVNHSPLFIEAIHALESNEYTVDDNMLSIALQVQAKLGADEDKEGYVIKGCQEMDSTKAYVSEFKGDDRGRKYQAACHGPNGQSSDRSRALMDLYGVPTDYDVPTVKKAIMAELADMCDDVKFYAKERKVLGDVDFIVKHIDGESGVSKPWSFVKGCTIMKELMAGNKPYIGMAVGLDAKCSGPQLGALMTGDQKLAAACGMTLVELEDAYHIAIQELDKAGFTGLTRSDVKKPYMGIFYGQGWAAFTDKEEVSDAVWSSLYGNGIANDDVAKSFHKAITASFGPKMTGVRNLIKDMAKKTQGRTKHFMPDGFEVAMNYKIKVNALGEIMEYDTARYDVKVRNNAEVYKFINLQMKTLDVHVGDFARNGFVNMIQATDALIARLIIVHLKRLGAKHIISVHDCFRVNVTELHLLEQAIKNAYQDLFGSKHNIATKDLPKGTDILALYFQGANKQLIEGEEEVMVSQFFGGTNKRRMTKVNGQPLTKLIDELGTSYYFAK